MGARNVCYLTLEGESMPGNISLQVNEKPVRANKNTRMRELVEKIKPGADIFVVNGFPVGPETLLQDGDACWIIKRGEKPSSEEMQYYLYARHTPGVQNIVRNSTVGIMGLGGLGSVVAVALARIGIGKLILADYDVVEPTNLNRQHYFWNQIGEQKTKALCQNISLVNPYVSLQTIDEELTEQTIPEYFHKVDVLCECFDDPAMKAAALRAAVIHLQHVDYVGSSGVAGCEDNNTIKTKKIRPHCYLVGDGETAAAPGVGLMAPRVGIAANHQANQVLRILLHMENGT